jgi:hypothetical protein
MSAIQDTLPPRLLLVYSALHMGICNVDKENSIINFDSSLTFDSTLALKYKVLLDELYQGALESYRQTYPDADRLSNEVQPFYDDLYNMLNYLIDNL